MSGLRRARDPQRGQAVYEFAILVPLFLLILLGLLEFGLAFSHDLTIEYATRAAPGRARPWPLEAAQTRPASTPLATRPLSPRATLTR